MIQPLTETNPHSAELVTEHRGAGRQAGAVRVRPGNKGARTARPHDEDGDNDHRGRWKRARMQIGIRISSSRRSDDRCTRSFSLFRLRSICPASAPDAPVPGQWSPHARRGRRVQVAPMMERGKKEMAAKPKWSMASAQCPPPPVERATPQVDYVPALCVSDSPFLLGLLGLPVRSTLRGAH